ncbi:MAG: phosphodiester glycosidase family protein [Prolixibacteraceae bacterium]
MGNIRFILSLTLLITSSFSGISQTIDLKKYRSPFQSESVAIYLLNDDSLFQEKQNIVIAEYRKDAFRTYKIDIAYSDSLLKKTSRFGEDSNSLVALNGSFFDVQKGGSVTYLESDGHIVARNRSSKENWAKTDSLLNGAIVLKKSGKLQIEIAKNSAYYEQSDKEKAVMVSGPILLVDGRKLPLENSDFVKKRHPRSCVCKTSTNSILFIAIDGRSKSASGMNLFELQQFLLRINCIDAINLDGGGSTTLWVNDGIEKKILNHPSDKEGERSVANILLIKNK